MMDYDKRTFVDGVASHGLLCFGIPCDLDAWLASPERIMRDVQDGMTAREINKRRWGCYVPLRVDVEDLKACARHGLLRCEKGKWFIQHNAQGQATAACVACGSQSEPYFSRIEPMGYFCPDCGHEDGKPYQPEKQFHGFVGEWVACSAEMPDDEITVLVWCGDDATLAFHDTEIQDRRGDSGWIMAGGSRVLLGVTHWCREIRQPNA